MRYHPDVTTETDAPQRFEEVRKAADQILNRVGDAPTSAHKSPSLAVIEWCAVCRYVPHVPDHVCCSSTGVSTSMQARRPTAQAAAAAAAAAEETSSMGWRTERLTRHALQKSLYHALSAVGPCSDRESCGTRRDMLHLAQSGWCGHLSHSEDCMLMQASQVRSAVLCSMPCRRLHHLRGRSSRASGPVSQQGHLAAHGYIS